jgi:hypothetical protein
VEPIQNAFNLADLRRGARESTDEKQALVKPEKLVGIDEMERRELAYEFRAECGVPRPEAIARILKLG